MKIEVEILKTFTANGKQFEKGKRVVVGIDAMDARTVYLEHCGWAGAFTTLVLGVDARLVKVPLPDRAPREPSKRVLLNPEEVQHLAGVVAERDRVRSWLKSRQEADAEPAMILEELVHAVLA